MCAHALKHGATEDLVTIREQFCVSIGHSLWLEINISSTVLTFTNVTLRRGSLAGPLPILSLGEFGYCGFIFYFLFIQVVRGSPPFGCRASVAQAGLQVKNNLNVASDNWSHTARIVAPLFLTRLK